MKNVIDFKIKGIQYKKNKILNKLLGCNTKNFLIYELKSKKKIILQQICIHTSVLKAIAGCNLLPQYLRIKVKISFFFSVGEEALLLPIAHLSVHELVSCRQ